MAGIGLADRLTGKVLTGSVSNPPTPGPDPVPGPRKSDARARVSRFVPTCGTRLACSNGASNGRIVSTCKAQANVQHARLRPSPLGIRLAYRDVASAGDRLP